MLRKSIGIFLIPLYTHVFSPAEYGLYDLMKSVSVLLLPLLVMGSDTALGLLYFDDENDNRKRRLASSVWISRLLISFFVLGLLALNIDLISNKLLNTPETKYLLFIILTLPFSLSIHLFTHILRLRFSIVKYNILSVGILLITVLLNLHLLLIVKVGVIGLFWSDLIAGVIFTLVGFYMTRDQFSYSFENIKIGHILSLGLPVLPSSLGLVFLKVSDRFFLLHFTSIEVVGLYAVGVKLGSLIGLITGSFQTAWNPFALSIAKEENSKEIYAKILSYYVLVTTTITIILVIFSREILTVFTSSSYIEASKVVGLVAFNMSIAQAYYIVSIGLSLKKKTGHIGWTLGSAIITTLIFDLLLIPRFGMIGAAIAPMIGYGLSSFLAYTVSKKYYQITFEWGRIVKILFSGLLLILLGNNIFAANISVGIFYKFLLICFLYPLLLFILGCISKDEINKIVNLIPKTK